MEDPGLTTLEDGNEVLDPEATYAQFATEEDW